MTNASSAINVFSDLKLSKTPGVTIALVTMMVIFIIAAPGFLSAANVSNVLAQATILLLISLPMTLIFMTEGIDLSVGAVLTVCSIVFALVVSTTGSLAFALAASVSTGVAFGLLNGVVITGLGIPPFVATLGVMGVAQGFALILSDGQSVVGISPTARAIYEGHILGVPIPAVIGAVAYAVFFLLLYKTRFGAYVVAVGGNREALTLAGKNWKVIAIATYVLGGAMAGIAALLFTARLNSAHPTAAIGMEFDAIAAVALGGTSFARGNGWLLGTLLGVLAVNVLRNGLNLLAVSSSMQVSCIGVLVIGALLIDGARSKST